MTSPADSASLIDYEATLDCVHCGLCLPVCPTYQETGRETSSPRGRIFLMRGVAEQRIPLDETVVDEMSLCLGCRACESACPAGVRYGHLIERMRAEIDRRAGRGRVARFAERVILRRMVGAPAALRSMISVLRLYQNTGLQRLVRAARVLKAMPTLRHAESSLPPLTEPHRPPVIVPAAGRRRGRVAFFAGCVMPELFASANQATIDVLTHNGFEVEIPPGQRCCGALHQHAGDLLAADRLHEKNRSAFHLEAVDAVIVNSAGCGASLKDRADRFSRKVRDITEFLVEVGFETPAALSPLRVAYDDPCHLLHGQGIATAPRQIMREIPGLDLVDLPGGRDCCGAAGTYLLTHPEMATSLLARKLQAIRDTAPQVVTTGNPGCLLQIASGVREAGLDVEVVHPVELLARAYAAQNSA
ncbi:MAG: (Fe-S)-binding protein [bacterium]|nr:(Fe-S)-binding protein [bacterium]